MARLFGRNPEQRALDIETSANSVLNPGCSAISFSSARTDAITWRRK
jgi:hypothetical protein